MVVIVNENEYNDDEYAEASLHCVDEVSGAIDRLWAAGAAVTDIENELTNALHNSEMPQALEHKVKIVHEH